MNEDNNELDDTKYSAEKAYELLTYWKEKFNNKDNERVCEFKELQLIQNQNKNELKKLKETNNSLYNKLYNAKNSHFKKFVNNVNKDDKDENLLFYIINSRKTNSILEKRFLDRVDRLNNCIFERRKLEEKVIDLLNRKRLLENDIELLRTRYKSVTLNSKIIENQNDCEKVKIKFEAANYVNNLLKEIKNVLIKSINEEKKQIEIIKNKIHDNIQQINDVKLQVRDNRESKEKVKNQVAILEKELSERKQKREEYTNVIQQIVEEAKTIDIDQNKIKSEKETKSLRKTLSTRLIDENTKEEEEFKLIYKYYENYLELHTISSVTNEQSIDGEIEKMKISNRSLLNTSYKLNTQKSHLKIKLEIITSEHKKQLFLYENQNKVSIEMNAEFDRRKELFIQEAHDLFEKKKAKGNLLNKIIAYVASICVKLLDFKYMNESVIGAKKKSNNHLLAPNSTTMLNKRNLIRYGSNDSLKLNTIPDDVFEQLDCISSVLSFIYEPCKTPQSDIESHYYINESLKYINFFQNSYGSKIQEEDNKSDDYEEDLYNFDMFNDYVSRDKIKIRSQDILNRKKTSKSTIKQFKIA